MTIETTITTLRDGLLDARFLIGTDTPLSHRLTTIGNQIAMMLNAGELDTLHPDTRRVFRVLQLELLDASGDAFEMERGR